jgi:hypothetical protein
MENASDSDETDVENDLDDEKARESEQYCDAMENFVKKLDYYESLKKHEDIKWNSEIDGGVSILAKLFDKLSKDGYQIYCRSGDLKDPVFGVSRVDIQTIVYVHNHRFKHFSIVLQLEMFGSLSIVEILDKYTTYENLLNAIKSHL